MIQTFGGGDDALGVIFPCFTQRVLTLMEMTLKNLTEDNKIDHQDFLDRVDILGALGKTVLISDFGEYYRLAAYFFVTPRR